MCLRAALRYRCTVYPPEDEPSSLDRDVKEELGKGSQKPQVDLGGLVGLHPPTVLSGREREERT